MTDKEIRLPESLDAETAADVLREFATTDDAQIVASDRLDTLENEIAEAREAFAAVLAEESPQSADALARQDMDALTEPFRDDEGAIDVDTLRQTPETGAVDGDGDEATDDADGFDVDALTLSERDELQRLDRKRTAFANRGMDGRAADLEAEIEALAGVDDYDDLELEAL